MITPEQRAEYYEYSGKYATDAEILDFIEKSNFDLPSRPTASRKTGGATHYYELPPDATELRHLIRYKKMSHPIGEAFCSLYRLHDNGEFQRNLEKVIYYCQCELGDYLKEQHASNS